MIPDSPVSSQGQPGQYAHYVLGVLFFVALFNYLDRMVLSILLEPIRAEFLLSDAQLGLLSGLVFAIFYAIFGIPIARVADRGHRVKVVSYAFVAWSLLTAACGMAQNFVQLLLARIGVAIGEAGAVPPSQSLLADYFPLQRRAGAFAVFSLGSNVGYFIGFAVGGLIAETIGWRWAFILLGLPGILFALLVRFTVREPRLEGAAVRQPVAQQSFREVLQFMFTKRSFIHALAAFSLYSMVSYGATQWVASFLIRTHAMSIVDVGVQYGAIVASSTGLGVLLSGWVTNRLLVRNLRYLCWLPALTCVALFPFCVIAFTVDSNQLALACLGVLGFGFGFIFPPTISIVHALAGGSRRATAAALAFLVSNLVGLGMGPVVIGLVSDLLSVSYADRSLAIALAAVHIVILWAAVHYYYAARTLSNEIEESI